MGECYYLVKEPEKLLFDLDKGSWSSLFVITPYYGYITRDGGYLYKPETFKIGDLFLDVDDLFKQIKEKVYYGHIGACTNKGENTPCEECDPYFLTLAERIFEWGKDDSLSLISDSTWESEDRYMYTVTQDRFVPNIPLPRTISCVGECYAEKCPFPRHIREEREMWCKAIEDFPILEKLSEDELKAIFKECGLEWHAPVEEI